MNLLTTWFLCDNGKAVIVDPTASNGASHDEWRQLLRRTGVSIVPDQLNAPWYQMARRDFLNWCENNLSETERPKLFDSKEAAEQWRDEQTSKSFEKSEGV